MSSEALTAELLTKFEKLLELEQRAATPGEAEAAAAAMTRLLTKHNLEALEVKRRLGSQGPKTDLVKSGWIEVPAAGWRKSLMWAVARNNFTTFVYYRRGGYLIGTGANIAATNRMYDTLCLTVEHLADLGWDEIKHDPPLEDRGNWYHYDLRPIGSAKWKNAFRLGCVSGIQDAMRRARQEIVEQTEGGSALVLVNQKELDAATRRYVGVTVKSKGSSITNADAYRRGYQAGQSVNVGSAGSLKGGRG